MWTVYYYKWHKFWGYLELSFIVESSMIHAESQDKNSREPVQLPSEFDSSEEKPQYSISGFIVNIVMALIWLCVFAVSSYVIFVDPGDDIMFFIPIFVTSLNMLSFHLYALIDPDYGNEKDEERDLTYVDILKKHWAVILGTTLVVLTFGFLACFLSLKPINEGNYMALGKLFLLLSAIFAVTGTICWGFVINDKKNIIARIVRPWQIHDNTESETV